MTAALLPSHRPQKDTRGSYGRCFHHLSLANKCGHLDASILNKAVGVALQMVTSGGIMTVHVCGSLWCVAAGVHMRMFVGKC